MEAITIPHVRIPSINIGGICLPGIGAPGSIGKKGLIWPAGMKEHIKAWYDPKKQGMTNFDVIESYVTDFTTWVATDSAKCTLTNRGIIISEVVNSGRLIHTNKLSNISIDIYVTGLTDDIDLYHYNNGDAQRIYNGVNKIAISANYNYFLTREFAGVCNITITQLPTSILKDFSGNGNHAYLYGGKGKLNSGMGVYQEDFSINTWNKTSFVFDYSHDYIKAKFKTINAGYRNVTVSNSNVSLNSMKIKVIIKGNSKDNRIMYSYADENGAQKVYYINNGETGIVPKSIATKTNDFLVGFRYNENNGDDCEITITQIPDYPDQLCYDGKMYAVCYGFPILTDYTVMAERTWFEKKDIRGFITKGQLFRFEWIVGDKEYTTNMNIDSSITFPNGISYQTKTSYNGKAIISSTYEDETTLIIGKRKEVDYDCFIGCHGAIIVADRSFTEEEINWLKQNWDKI